MAIWGFQVFLVKSYNFKTSKKTVLTFYQERIVSESFERIGILALYTNIQSRYYMLHDTSWHKVQDLNPHFRELGVIK